MFASRYHLHLHFPFRSLRVPFLQRSSVRCRGRLWSGKVDGQINEGEHTWLVDWFIRTQHHPSPLTPFPLSLAYILSSCRSCHFPFVSFPVFRVGAPTSWASECDKGALERAVACLRRVRLGVGMGSMRLGRFWSV